MMALVNCTLCLFFYILEVFEMVYIMAVVLSISRMGSIRYEGDFSGGKWCGKGRWNFGANLGRHEGFFWILEMPSGPGVRYHAPFREISHAAIRGNFLKGIPEGYICMFLNLGIHLQRLRESGERAGVGESFGHGSSYRGEFKDDLFHGRGTCIRSRTSASITGTFENGIIVGIDWCALESQIFCQPNIWQVPSIPRCCKWKPQSPASFYLRERFAVARDCSEPLETYPFSMLRQRWVKFQSLNFCSAAVPMSRFLTRLVDLPLILLKPLALNNALGDCGCAKA